MGARGDLRRARRISRSTQDAECRSWWFSYSISFQFIFSFGLVNEGEMCFSDEISACVFCCWPMKIGTDESREFMERERSNIDIEYQLMSEHFSSSCDATLLFLENKKTPTLHIEVFSFNFSTIFTLSILIAMVVGMEYIKNACTRTYMMCVVWRRAEPDFDSARSAEKRKRIINLA